MRDKAIEVRDLCKAYRLGQTAAATRTLREAIHGLFNRGRGARTARRQPFWALKDVSFDVEPGEVVGIIGRNGAGKSTLLKILSRITDPSAGSAVIRGRVGSLLEVGTGFHPELSGRENVYLNGAILGMRRADIRRRFDAIVEFAGVEPFLDTPVKRYSSGMYVRLAFAVAAHLDPQILLVDEVLAVGDAAFQQRCLGKMSDVARHGRTVLFVSHNMAAVRSLCPRVVWLAQGQVKAVGTTDAVVTDYLAQVHHRAAELSLRTSEHREGTGQVRLIAFRLEDETGRPVDRVQTGQSCRFIFEFETPDGLPPRNVSFAFGLRDRFETRLTRLSCDDQSVQFDVLPRRGAFCCRIERLPLGAGQYTIGAIVTTGGQTADLVLEAATVRVEPGDYYQRGRLTTDGPVFIPHSWSLQHAA